MAPLFRRSSNVTCFFCNSTVFNPRNPTNFRCPSCGCRNQYNNKGEILSDEPAMHLEDLNRENFSKRASFSKNQLPTDLNRTVLFCHNCSTNQTLILSLLGNYLPSPDSPDYQQRVNKIPDYKESLYKRYPPLCESCRPAVEEEIQRKEQMARRKALNGWLQGGKERHRKVSGTPAPKEKIVLRTIQWRIRGLLWFASSCSAITSLILALVGRSILPHIPPLALYSLPFCIIVSLLWTVWDPTYIVLHKAQQQNRDVRLNGKRDYILCQMSAWLSRLVFSTVLVLNRTKPHLVHGLFEHHSIFVTVALLTELLALVASPLFLRIHHPPPIRLIDTHAHLHTQSRSATPTTPSSHAPTPAPSFPRLSEHDLLASLSLSSKPIMTPPPNNPVFGLPSLGSSSSFTNQPEPRVEDDAMDWQPINQDGRSNNHRPAADNSSWLRPQQFFAPEKPTGLESLFERTRLDDSDMMQIDGQESSKFSARIASNWRDWLIPILMVICATASAYFAFRLIKWKEPPRYDVRPPYSPSYPEL